MESLKILSKKVNTQIAIYTGDEKGSLECRGPFFIDSKNPESFNLPENTFMFNIKDIETLTTPDGKTYVGGDKGQFVYMGKAITIEEAAIAYPNRDFSYPESKGAKRVAIRYDGRVSEMFHNGITYDEYCQQYNLSQIKPLLYCVSIQKSSNYSDQIDYINCFNIRTGAITNFAFSEQKGTYSDWYETITSKNDILYLDYDEDDFAERTPFFDVISEYKTLKEEGVSEAEINEFFIKQSNNKRKRKIKN